MYSLEGGKNQLKMLQKNDQSLHSSKRFKVSPCVVIVEPKTMRPQDFVYVQLLNQPSISLPEKFL
jgi:hypothetical protein